MSRHTVMGAIVGLSTLVASAATAADAKQWAILIGVEKYHRAPGLRYTVNDVRQLSATLQKRGNYSPDRILEMSDALANPRYQPLKASLMVELPERLQRPAAGDSVLVFFSGHGFRDSEGKMYLAPLDCDPANPAATGISVQWFRQQIAACKAGFKLLILDTCHAGSEKGDDEKGLVAAKDLGEPFKDMEGVVTLASSMANEKSQIWEEKQQSLFSYWLNQGLRGHADDNGDGTVDIDELYKYVHHNVTATAKSLFPLKQTPVRIVRSGTPDVPVVVRLLPQTLRQVLSDMAEQLSNAIQQRQLRKVGVLEFTNDTKLGELLGADFGLLGKYCAEEMERRLVDASAGSYNMVNRRQLQKALSAQQFKLDDLGSPEAVKQLAGQAGGMPVLVLGTLRSRTGRVVHMQCKLLRTDSDEMAGAVGGAAMLNESEWAMLGRSIAVRPDDRRNSPIDIETSRPPTAENVVNEADRRSQGPHPLLDPSFPYRVTIVVDGKQREGTFKGNDYFVPLRKGEVYQIDVDNRSGKMVLMRLLVDGLNTLPEEEKTKGVRTFLVGKRVNLDEARYWVLDPAQASEFAVRGFVTTTGVQGKLREFVVVDADKSLAARQQFTDQIGLITAAFYAPASTSRAVGTAMGNERDEDLKEKEGTAAGNLLGVVHIRYVDADAIPSH